MNKLTYNYGKFNDFYIIVNGEYLIYAPTIIYSKSKMSIDFTKDDTLVLEYE